MLKLLLLTMTVLSGVEQNLRVLVKMLLIPSFSSYQVKDIFQGYTPYYFLSSFLYLENHCLLMEMVSSGLSAIIISFYLTHVHSHAQTHTHHQKWHKNKQKNATKMPDPNFSLIYMLFIHDSGKWHLLQFSYFHGFCNNLLDLLLFRLGSVHENFQSLQTHIIPQIWQRHLLPSVNY